MDMSKKLLNVSIALIFYQNKVLVGWREAKQHQGNKYEFPGGKVEAGETAEQACYREIQEEVGITLDSLQKFDQITHEYDDLIVALHIFQVGISTAQWGQIKAPWQWYNRSELLSLNFPKANQSIVERLYWPNSIRIINADAVTDLTSVLNQAGVSYLRHAHADADQKLLVQQLGQAFNATSFVKSTKQELIVNFKLWQQLDLELREQIYAVHFSHQQLMQLNLHDVPFSMKKMASCHDQQSIQKAIELGMDAVFLSPVLDTPTHPKQPGLGWVEFQQLAAQIQVPVFALGGMHPELLQQAQLHGAYGIAGIRNF